MKDVLFLAHRLPFPPDKGDKIRSFHLFEHLCDRYRVHLGTFVDDPNDEQYVDHVESMCTSAKILRLRPTMAKIRSLTALLTGDALSIPYYFDRRMAEWVNDVTAQEQIGSAVVYSSPMGQYVNSSRFAQLRRVMDFVDVDSDKWAQYASGKRWPMSWVYKREARTLLNFEKEVAGRFDASMFVTQNEVDLFATLAPDVSGKLHAIGNGVAVDYFDPATELASPYSGAVRPLVFTGMMDYWANVDAVAWFATEVFPTIRSAIADAEFWIVGASPTPEVTALADQSGVHVTGRVPDVRPYLRHAALGVAPLRIARGIQNKVLEALAMGLPVLATEHAASGLEASQSVPLFVEDEPARLASRAIEFLNEDSREHVSDAARRYVIEHYGWAERLTDFERVHARPVA